MPTLNRLFFNLLLPAIVCGGIYTIAAYLWKRYGKRENLQWLITFALGIGYIVGYFGIEGRQGFLPRENINWIFIFTLFAIGSCTYWHLARWRSLISQLIYSIVLPRVLLDAYFRNTWGPLEGKVWWLCLALGILIFCKIVQLSLSALPSNASSPFVYFGISGGTTLILALSGSMRLAQHAGILVALFAAIWILAIVLPRTIKFDIDSNWEVLPISISPVVIILLVCIWLNGYFYAEVPSASAILLAVSPFLAQVGKIPAIQQLKGRKSVFIQVGLIALCVCIAVIIAVFRSGLFGGDAY
ncbi:MAG: hypothetical protein OXU23_09380 [Candidatus Poribacteria bacterium]|nr:hypothetical protein [Candidatus Poribacteria bacterium]